ncbi:MAG: accessory gene regulator AgrB [Dethiobacteria bacterium]
MNLNFVENASRSLAMAITDANDRFSSPEKAAELEYGIYMIISTILKTAIILILAYFLGIFNYVLLSYVCFGTLRTFAGGAHARTSWGCFVYAVFIYFPIVYLAVSYPLPAIPTYLLFFISLIIIAIYAPADVEENPILRLSRRRRLKIYSLITLIIFLAVAIFQRPIISSIITLSVFMESLTLTPVFYALTKSKQGGDDDEEN